MGGFIKHKDKPENWLLTTAVIRVVESHSKASSDYNLLVVNPLLCKEWHPKNKKLSEYLPKSGKKGMVAMHQRC